MFYLVLLSREVRWKLGRSFGTWTRSRERGYSSGYILVGCEEEWGNRGGRGLWGENVKYKNLVFFCFWECRL